MPPLDDPPGGGGGGAGGGGPARARDLSFYARVADGDFPDPDARYEAKLDGVEVGRAVLDWLMVWEGMASACRAAGVPPPAPDDPLDLRVGQGRHFLLFRVRWCAGHLQQAFAMFRERLEAGFAEEEDEAGPGAVELMGADELDLAGPPIGDVEVRLRPTADTVTIGHHVPARIWRGATARGEPVLAVVVGVRASTDAGAAELAASLRELPVRMAGGPPSGFSETRRGGPGPGRGG